MSDLQFRTPGKPATEGEVADFEQGFAITLPADYRKFLVETNGGGQPKRCLFKFENGEEAEVKSFHSLKGDSYMSLENAVVRMKPFLPLGVIPVGGDVFGNGICLFTSGKHHGEIWFWDHEQEPREKGPEEITFIAPTFQKFIDGLYSRPEQALDEIEWMGKFGKTKDFLGFLGKSGDLEAKNKYGRTVFKEAARYGNIELMEVALAHGAKTNGAIHLAAMNNQVEAIDVLLKHGVDINERDGEGKTPLGRAWKKEFADTLKVKGATL